MASSDAAFPVRGPGSSGRAAHRSARGGRRADGPDAAAGADLLAHERGAALATVRRGAVLLRDAAAGDAAAAAARMLVEVDALQALMARMRRTGRPPPPRRR